MAKKEKATAKQPKKETAEANDKRTAVKPKTDTIKLEITGGVAWLGWSARIGQVIEVKDKKQAEEAINAGRAKYV